MTYSIATVENCQLFIPFLDLTTSTPKKAAIYTFTGTPAKEIEGKIIKRLAYVLISIPFLPICPLY